MRVLPTRRALGLGLFLAVACHDAGTSPRDPGPPASGTAAEVLTVDLHHPPDYSNPAWPADFDDQVLSRTNDRPENPVTNRGALLGRVLFYDRNLSINQRVSCSSCHRQATGFTDNSRFSIGFNGSDHTAFRTMRLLNARFFWSGYAFWDRRVASLEDQSTQPIQNSVEMGFDSTHGGIDSLLTRLNGLAYYRELSAWVYGDSTLTQAGIQLALAQFVRSLVSYSSRFDSAWVKSYDPSFADKGLSLPFRGLTSRENRGKQLFLTLPVSGGAGCASCHMPPSFALAGNSMSNGLDLGETRRFKAPSLKSIAVGGPYMHDGRFSTLAQVVDFYLHRIKDGPALDTRLRGPGGTPQRLALSNADQEALVAFLKTLTDGAVAGDPKFSNPFRH